jgi:HEAT repeat protein
LSTQRSRNIYESWKKKRVDEVGSTYDYSTELNNARAAAAANEAAAMRRAEEFAGHLVRVDAPRAAPILVKQLKDEDRAFRVRMRQAMDRVIQELAGSPDPQIASLLLDLLRDASEDDDNQTADKLIDAVAAMGLAGMQTIASALQDPSIALRRSLTRLLEKVGNAMARQSLKTLLEDPDERVRQEAASALGSIETPRGVDEKQA